MAIRAMIALFAVLDPLAAIPIFLTLTRDQSAADRKRTALITALAVGGLLCAAALVGESLLTAFGTSLAAFRVGGGIVVLMMAVSMLIGLNVAIRLFGLVLAAIAVEFIVNGLKQMLPVLDG